jgi:hypothetical protein
MKNRWSLCAVAALCTMAGAASAAASPALTVSEIALGSWQFVGIAAEPVDLAIVANIALDFSWSAQPGEREGAVTGYRYGWDVVDPNDPDDPGWALDWQPNLHQAPPRAYSSGVHSLHIAARTEEGLVTRGWFLFTVQPQVPAQSISLGAVKATYRD